jgi:hypothetical protein
MSADAYIFTGISMGFGSPQFLHLKERLEMTGYDVTLVEPKDDLRNSDIEYDKAVYSNKIELYFKVLRLAIIGLLFKRDMLVILGVNNPSFCIFPRNITLGYYYLEVFDWRNFDEESAFGRFKRKLRGILSRKVEFVIAPQKERLEMGGNQFPNAKTFLVLNAPPLVKDKVLNFESEGDLRVIYHGQLGESSQASKLISLFEEAQDFCDFVLAGRVEEEYKSDIERLDEEGVIRYLGFVEHSALESVRSSCDIGLVTWGNSSNGDKSTPDEAYKYAAPNKLFEYIRDGLAVVSFNNYSISDWNKKYKFGFVASDNLSDSKRFLEWLYQNKDDLEELKKHNRDLYLSELNYDQQTEYLIEYLSE